MHLSLYHQSKTNKIHRCGSLLQEYLLFATTLSYFSSPLPGKPKPHFPDPPLSSTSTPEHHRSVFLSFRGTDTRNGFVKSLHRALCFAGIRAFKDDVDLRKGCRIQRGLMDAIRQSWLFIPVISANFASSKWCLDELAEIMKCVRMEKKKTVFPVFYDVRPAEVRHLTGPFSAAFAKLDDEDGTKVKTWKRALSEVADFSGFDLLHTYQRDEAKCIEDIVEEVGNKLGALKREKFTTIAAIEYHLSVLNSLLRVELSKDQ